MTQEQVSKLLRQNGLDYQISYNNETEWSIYEITNGEHQERTFQDLYGKVNHEIGVVIGEFDRRISSLKNLENSFHQGPFGGIPTNRLPDYKEMKGNIELHLEKFRIKWIDLEKLKAALMYLYVHPDEYQQGEETFSSSPSTAEDISLAAALKSTEERISSKLETIHSAITQAHTPGATQPPTKGEKTPREKKKILRTGELIYLFIEIARANNQTPYRSLSHLAEVTEVDYNECILNPCSFGHSS